MLPIHEAAVRHLLGQYRHDPVRYATEALGERLTPDQAAILRRLTEPPYRVLARAAHKVGKTRVGAVAVQWHHDSFDPGLVIATAPGEQSLKKQLFKEVRATRPFQLGLLPQACEVRHHEEHVVLGVLSKNPDAFQGKHGLNTLLAMDEMTAIPQTIVDRGEGIMKQKPGFGWLGFYNPYDPTTPPYLLEQSGEWHVLHLSALDHPNVAAALRGEPPPVPAAVELADLVRRVLKECEFCGETPADESCFLWPSERTRGQVPDDAGDLPWGWYKPMTVEFEVQVLGRWPSSAFDAVWNDADWKRCLPPTAVDPEWPVQLGCDVARGGHDKVAIAVRKGPCLVRLEKFSVRGQPRPSKRIGDRLRVLCQEHAPEGTDPREVPVLVDDTGGYGSGVTDHPEGHAFFGVNSSEKAYDERKYPNRRSELWFTVRLAADVDALCVGTVRHGRELVGELEADLKAARYSLDKRNRRVVEGKDAVKARLKRSPDVADAVCLAYYPVPGEG